MSELSKNQLLSRRSFFERATNAAKVAGVGAALASLPRTSPGAPAPADRPNPWAYDDTPYRRTDQKLIRYQESKRFQSVRRGPRCLAVTREGRLWIGAGKYLTQYSPEVTHEIALTAEVRCLDLGEDSSLFVGFRDHLEVLDSQGQRQAVWESPGKKAYLTAVAVSGTDVFVADAGSRVVLRYDRSGKLKNRIGEKNPEQKTPGFIVPSPFFDVQVAPDGLLRVTNPGRHRVEAYTFDGDLEFAWGNPGAAIENFCGCCNPIKLALLPDGRVVTFEKGIPRVKVYNAQGTFESVVAGAESFAENAKVCGPNDCTLGGLNGAVDAQGRVYVLDLVAAEVRVMERKAEGA